MFTLKRIITGIVSSVFLAVSVFVPLSVSADETEPWYTFDELLAMSKEEICSISDAYADAYADGEVTYDNNKSFSNGFFNETAHFIVCFYEETAYEAAQEADTMLHTFMSDLQLPEQLAPESHISNGEVKMYPGSSLFHFADVTRTAYYTSLYCGNYKDYNPRDVFIALCLTVRFHPNTYYFYLGKIPTGPSTAPPDDPPADKTEPWYPLDTLLEMTEEEICSISDAYAKAYAYAKSQFEGIKIVSGEDTASIGYFITIHDFTAYQVLLDPFTLAGNKYISAKKFMTELQFPEQLFRDCPNGSGCKHIMDPFFYSEYEDVNEKPTYLFNFYFNNYKEYSEQDVYIATVLTFEFHPNIDYCIVDMPALSPATAPPEPDDLSETTAFAVTDPVQTQTQAAAAAAQTTAAADPQTTAASTAASQTNASSPKTGDDGTIFAVILAGLSLGGCVLMKKMKRC